MTKPTHLPDEDCDMSCTHATVKEKLTVKPVEPQECEHKDPLLTYDDIECKYCGLKLSDTDSKPQEAKVEQLDKTVHFGAREATLTDVHNSLVPYYNKVNELIKAINKLNGHED